MSKDKFGRFSDRAKVKIGPRGLQGERGPQGIPGPPGEGFFKTEAGDYNLKLKRLQNIQEPQDKRDATSKTYVDEKIEHMQRNFENEIHLIQQQFLNAYIVLKDPATGK